MAVIVAQANGNFSDTATWTGGVVPGAGDTAQTGNYVVTIDASITCTLNLTGSGYFVVTTGGITITGDVVMQSSYVGGGLRCTHSSGTVALTGTATGGAGYFAHGAANEGAGTMTVGTATGGAGSYAYGAANTGSGTMTVGTATGGVGSNAYGAGNTGTGTMTVSTATGGAGSYAYGAANTGSGTMTVSTATGGVGDFAYGAANTGAGTMTVSTATSGAGYAAYGATNAGAGTMTVDLAVGNNWGVGGSGNYAYGVYGNGAVGQTTRVKRTQSGPYGAPAIGGAVLIEADISNSAQFRTAYGGATLTLTDPSASADWPAEADVRAGVEYDLGDKTGTAHIPAAGQVALGVPVDATTGTAVLTAAAVTAGVWDAARSGHAGAGTFGATAEWAGNVDENAIATAAADAILAAADSDPISANVTYWAGVAAGAAPATVADLPAAAPSAATVADAVWDEALSGHSTPGSTGAALSAAGDPWSVELPGSYLSDQAGGIIGRLAEIDTTAVTATVSSLAGHLAIVAARTFAATVSGLTIPSDWAAAIWTLKTSASEADDAALVRLRASNPSDLEADGLERLNGAALSGLIQASDGSLTVDQAGGSVAIWLSDELTALLAETTGLGWDVKFIDDDDDSSGVRGTADVALTETWLTA